MSFSNEIGQGIVKIKADLSSLTTSLNKARTIFNTSLNKMSAAAKSAGLKMSLFLTAPILLALRQGAQAWATQEKAVIKVAAAIKSTGGAAGKTLDQLTKSASMLQEKTIFGDEEILGKATSSLLRFTNIAGTEFDRAQMAALDMSSALGTDLQSAALIVGKALSDPVGQLGSLTRYAIVFTDEEKKMVKQMVEANKVAEAQQFILAALEQKFGGTAEAVAKAGLGPWKQFTNQLGDLSEVLSGIVFEKSGPLISFLRDAVSYLQDLSPEAKKMLVTLTGVLAIAGPLSLLMGALLTPIGLVVTALTSLGLAFYTFYDEIAAYATSTFRRVEAEAKEFIANMKIAFHTLNDIVTPDWLESAVGIDNKLRIMQAEEDKRAAQALGLSATSDQRKALQGFEQKWDEIAAPIKNSMDAISNSTLEAVGTFDTFGDTATENFKKVGKEAETTASKIQTSLGQAFQSLGQSIGSGGSFDAGSILGPLLGSVGGMFGNFLGEKVGSWFTSGSSGSGGGGGASIGPSVTGVTNVMTAAGGGFIDSPTLVGERGPEVFIPHSPGTVVPNNELGGRGVTIHQNINLMPDVGQAFKEQLVQSMPLIRSAAVQGVEESRARRGLI